MTNLSKVRFCELLPPNLNDIHIKALGSAFDSEYYHLIQKIQTESMTFAFVMELDEEIADHLCLSLDIKGYKADLPLQKKRLLIRSALLNYSRMGTKMALEDAVGTIYGGTTVQENWEYGGKPYHFRAMVDAGQEPVPENPVGRLLETIMQYKNVRSWLDGITVNVIEPGSIYCGAMQEVGIMLMVDPYRVQNMVSAGDVNTKAMAMAGTQIII